MATNDFSQITSIDQLRTVIKGLSAETSAYENRFSGRMHDLASVFGWKILLLPVIRILRKTISGTPFAKS